MQWGIYRMIIYRFISLIDTIGIKIMLTVRLDLQVDDSTMMWSSYLQQNDVLKACLVTDNVTIWTYKKYIGRSHPYEDIFNLKCLFKIKLLRNFTLFNLAVTWKNILSPILLTYILYYKHTHIAKNHQILYIMMTQTNLNLIEIHPCRNCHVMHEHILSSFRCA